MFPIANRNMSVIARNLGIQLSPEGMPIEKSIEIIKTGKEVKNAMQSRIKQINDGIALLRGVQKDCRTKIGYDPDSGSGNGEDKVSGDYPELPVNYDGKVNVRKGEDNYILDYNTSPPNDIEKCKRQYNSAGWRIANLIERRDSLQTLIDNLKDGQRFKLSTYELEQFGFTKALMSRSSFSGSGRVRAHTRKSKRGKLSNVHGFLRTPAHMYSGGPGYEPKDRKRFEDIIRKSTNANGDVDEVKVANHVIRMANAIGHPDKAMRRARVFEAENWHGMAAIFYHRAKQLGYGGKISKSVPTIKLSSEVKRAAFVCKMIEKGIGRVKAHTRKSKSGKIERVSEHQRMKHHLKMMDRHEQALIGITRHGDAGNVQKNQDAFDRHQESYMELLKNRMAKKSSKKKPKKNADDEHNESYMKKVSKVDVGRIRSGIHPRTGKPITPKEASKLLASYGGLTGYGKPSKEDVQDMEDDNEQAESRKQNFVAVGRDKSGAEKFLGQFPGIFTGKFVQPSKRK